MAIKKALELGMGIASLGAKAAHRGFETLQKKGHITKKEQEALLKQFVKESKKKREEFVLLARSEGERVHKQLVEKAGYVKQSDYAKLEKRLVQLEKAVGKKTGVKKAKKA